MNRLLFSIAFCIAVMTPALSQGMSEVHAVRARFDTPQSVKWVHTFKGFWQSLHPVTLILGFDGKEYHGTLQSLSDGSKFSIEGTHEDNELRLHEIDPSGRTSGYILGAIKDGRLTAQWWSVDFSRAATLVLRNEEIVELRSFQPEILFLEGAIANTQYQLTVQREEPDLISGYAVILDDPAFYKVVGKCMSSTCDQMSLELNSPDGISYALECTRSRSATFKATIKDPDGRSHTGSLTEKESHGMQRQMYASYVGNVDYMYPLLGIPAFDNWLGGQFESWFTRSKLHLDSIEKAEIVPGPALRCALQASAWTDMTLVTPETISGFVTMYDVKRRAYVRNAFVFDVRNERLQFIRDMGKKAQFESSLMADATELRIMDSDDQEYMTWSESSPLRHIALTWDGFVIFTDFDPVFGETWVKLSYADYMDDIKRNALSFDPED